MVATNSILKSIDVFQKFILLKGYISCNIWNFQSKLFNVFAFTNNLKNQLIEIDRIMNFITMASCLDIEKKENSLVKHV